MSNRKEWGTTEYQISSINHKISEQLILNSKRPDIVDSIVDYFYGTSEYILELLCAIELYQKNKPNTEIDYLILERILNKVECTIIKSSLFFYPQVKNKRYLIILGGLKYDLPWPKASSYYWLNIKNIPKDLHEIPKDQKFKDPYV